MSSLAQLEAYANEIANSVKGLVDYCRNVELRKECSAGAVPQQLVPVNAPVEVHQARRSILTNVARLQSLLSEPTDFLQQLATKSQLLACLHWLGEFQVLACIPLSHSVPFKDVADLAGVPEPQLCRVVRMMATASFLQEPQPGHVAHSSLSAPFVTKPSYLDAAMFLSETAAPAALHMAAATRRFGDSPRPNESAYNIAFNTSSPFVSACEQRPKIKRQWPSYLRYGMGDVESDVLDILPQFDWSSLGNASVVKVGAQSTATVKALASLYPQLQFIVQTSEPGAKKGEHYCPRIAIQQRVPGALQTIHDAAVYILRLPSPSHEMPSHAVPAHIIAELRAHLGMVRTSNFTLLVLTPRLVPESGTVDPDVEMLARLRDLSLLQLANDREMETFELMDLINSVRDSKGQLMIVNKLQARNTANIALEVRYQPYNNSHEL